jgi:signal transduction histidine kinase
VKLDTYIRSILVQVSGSSLPHRLAAYAVAVALPLVIIVAGATLGLPEFAFEDIAILIVVGCALKLGVGPAVTAAVVLSFGDDILLREPIGRATITGVRDLIDVTLFLSVAGIVAWLVARVDRERRRAQAAVEERDRLIATITHDLGTPLAAIRGTVQFVRRFGTSADVDLNRLLARLDTASARATSLIRMLTDARAIESGGLQLQTARTDVRECLTPVVQMLERVSDHHQIATAMPDHPVLVEADADRLQRVFENLVSNAIKYSPGGGPVEISLSTDDRGAVVQVRDYGMGISQEALPHLFERAYRAPEAASAAAGMGLGLTISAEIVKRHGGTIHAAAAQPKGALVTVTLPLASGASVAAVQPRAAT